MGSAPPVISDVQVLAAVRRAELHRGEAVAAHRRGIQVWHVLEQLAVRKRTKAARSVLASLESLTQGGAIEFVPRKGAKAWALTDAGRRRVRRAGAIELPESPQHRAWRYARTLAEQEIDRMRESLHATLAEAMEQLGSDASSDVWFELSERLRRDARLLGSATYCSREWAEPSDSRPDIDDYLDPSDTSLPHEAKRRLKSRRVGRRNVLLWSDEEL